MRVDDLPRLANLSSEYLADPLPFIAQFAKFGMSSDDVGSLVLYDSDLIEKCLHDGRSFRAPSIEMMSLGAVVDGPLAEWSKRSLVFTDGGRHSELKGLVARRFSVRGVAEQSALIRSTIEGVLTELNASPGDEFDWMSQIAGPAFMTSLGAFLGFDMSEGPTAKWMPVLPKLFTYEAGNHLEDLHSAFEEISLWARSVIAERGRQEAFGGVFADANDDEDAVAMFFQILSGGWETTSAASANIAVQLMGTDRWGDELREPQRLGFAIRASMAACPAALGVARVVAHEMIWNDVALAEGQLVICMTSANRAATDQPGAAGLLAFGAGQHRCLGADLAVVQLSALFSGIAERWPNAQVLASETWTSPHGTYRPEAVRFRPFG